MQKRGQIYLFAAIILGFIIFLVVAERNIVRETVIDDDFESLAKNYEVESANFMNLLLERNKDVPKEFLKFTILFSSYAKTKNPEFGTIYAFISDGHLYIGNYLDTEIHIKNAPLGKENLEGCYQKVNANIVVAGFPTKVTDVSTGAYSSCMLDMPVPVANTLRFTIEGVEYETVVEDARPEIIIVSRENIDNQKKVYVKGNFKKGKNTV